MPKVLVVIHLPLFRDAATVSNLRKIVHLDAVPRVGDTLALPGWRELPVGRVKFRSDGHVSVHIDGRAEILELTTDGGPAGVSDMAADLRVAGYTEITDWDRYENPEEPIIVRKTTPIASGASLMHSPRRKPEEDPFLTANQVAERLGWATSASVRVAVHAGYLPPPDDLGDPALPANRRGKRWLTSTITTYIANRPGQGARTDLKATS